MTTRDRRQRRTTIVVQFVLLIAICLGLGPAKSQAFAAVTVSGTVTQSGSTYYPDGVLLWVKLVQGTTVVQVVQPNTVTGAYTFTGVAAGSYNVIVSNNNSTTDATPSHPLINTFNTPGTGSTAVVVGAINVTGVNFTLNYTCSCGYGDGRLTTGLAIPMTTNGDMSAWGNVTTDSDNNSCDSTNPDRDAPIQSTGRDLLQFSYTYDNSNLYGYTTRVASESNTDNFIYYADVNNNGLMEAGEPVIYVSWQGSNRGITVGLGTYIPANPGGDPLASTTTGYADGYGMPGSISNGHNLQSGPWGSNTGTAMQWYISWSQLGIAPGTVIRWHISSTNSTPTANSLASQIDDNMGGCGGCVASNQYGGVAISGTTNAVVPSPSTVYLPHTITNAGNGTDTFTFATTVTGGWTPSTIAYYKDNGVVGVYEPGIDTLITNSGAIASGASSNILVAVTPPAGATGTDTISFKATSSYIPACGTGGTSANATATDTIRVGSIISGTVFNDANHNGTIDSGETGTAQTLYAKLLNGSTLVATVAVDPATGAYTFPPELPATYTVILSNNNLATSLVASYPSGWVPTLPNTGSASVAVTTADVPNTNFGLFHGSSISAGVAFSDVGGPYPPLTPVATANNGVQDNASFEAGIQNVTVKATDSAGTTLYDTAITDATGKFSLYIPSTATSLSITKTPIANSVATGGTVGTTGGTYARAAETITGITPAAGTAYTGVSFGSVPVNTLTTNNAATIQAGSSTYYPHTFTANTLGTVTFSTSAVVVPTQAAWTETVYHDLNCSGVFNASDPVISGAQTISTPGAYCILVKETVPTGVSGTNTVTVTATFVYTNANPALSKIYTNTDTTTAGYTISGSVYNDANHNSTRDSGEVGTGLTLYAKIVKVISGTPTVMAVTTVDTTTTGGTSGAYSFPSSPQGSGSYSVVLSTNNLTSDATAILPAGWLGTQNGSGTIAVTITTADSANNNFGLFHGSSILGTVFLDNGAGGGTANDGVKQSGETGLQNVTITATNGATVYDTQTSVAAGTFTLWVPSTATSVTVTRVATSGYMATGGSAGTTAGTYSRAQETVTFTNTSGTGYTGILFGDVPVNTLSNDNNGTLQQGSSNYYPHTFVAGSVGTVTFTTSAVSNPTLSGWVEAVYIDSNCNGVFDAGEPLATAQAVTPGMTICVLVKETSPSTGTGQNTVTLQANMTYSNANPALNTTVTRQDVTSSATGPIILIQKAVNKTQAYPGDTLVYTITYTNIGGFPARNMAINDSVPTSTGYVSASCGTPLPASFTACSVTQSPAVGGSGAVVWTFTGTLSPNGTGTVTLQVKVN